MTESNLSNTVGKSVEFRIGNSVIDLYPIRVRDWPEASKLMYLLSFDSLADIAYIDALNNLTTLIRVAARNSGIQEEGVFDCLEDMTDREFKALRNILSMQNDIDMDRLMARLSKVTGGSKNAETPTSL